MLPKDLRQVITVDASHSQTAIPRSFLISCCLEEKIMDDTQANSSVAALVWCCGKL